MAEAPKEGDVAPNFSLPDDSGGVVNLSDFAGKVLVLYFYPKDDTTGCTTEAIDFTSLSDDFNDAGAAVVGISPDPVASHEKFKRKYDLSVVLASDESRKTLNDYGVWVLKTMYGRQYMGVERTTYLIDGQGRIARVWRKVKVADHAAQVLDAVKEMQAV